MHSSEEYLGQKTDSVFKFKAVNEECIDKIIKKLTSKFSTSYDNILNELIKHARTILVKLLALLANQINNTGEFFRQLKIARDLYIKKVMSQAFQIIVPYPCYLLFYFFLKK